MATDFFPKLLNLIQAVGGTSASSSTEAKSSSSTETKLSDKLGREIEYREVFVDYEEGKTLFPNKSTWQNPDSYPAFRVDFYNPRLPCIFYNTKVKACSMYDIRPKTCQEYECEYLSNNT
jgi:Fe-S-cluster containining protein